MTIWFQRNIISVEKNLLGPLLSLSIPQTLSTPIHSNYRNVTFHQMDHRNIDLPNDEKKNQLSNKKHNSYIPTFFFQPTNLFRHQTYQYFPSSSSKFWMLSIHTQIIQHTTKSSLSREKIPNPNTTFLIFFLRTCKTQNRWKQLMIL